MLDLYITQKIKRKLHTEMYNTFFKIARVQSQSPLQTGTFYKLKASHNIAMEVISQLWQQWACFGSNTYIHTYIYTNITIIPIVPQIWLSHYIWCCACASPCGRSQRRQHVDSTGDSIFLNNTTFVICITLKNKLYSVYF